MRTGINEFAEKVRECIEEKLAEEGTNYTVTIQEKTKNNDIKLHGIAIRPEGLSAVPLIYLENYYGDTDEERSVEDVSDAIISLSRELRERTPAFRMPDLDYDNIRDMLRVKLVNNTSSPQVLRNMVHRDVGCGFSLTAYIDLPRSSGLEGMIQVSRELAKAADYDRQKIMDTALYNSASMDPAYLKRISEMVLMDDGEDLLNSEKRGEDSILVLGHESTEFGAVALYYPGIKEKISEIVGGDYFILPSSVHELLVVPDNGAYSSSQLMDMVMSVNSTELLPQDRLADRVLLYRSDLKMLTVAEDMEHRSVLDITR